MNRSQIGVRFDAGWLFVVAGLVICASGVLIPAQNDLARTRQQLAELKREEAVANDRLAAHTDFLAEIDRADPSLVQRLAASQLNLMREGDKPLLIASTVQQPVTDWINASVPERPPTDTSPPRSALSALSTGLHRLWFLASGVLCVFIGLILDHSLPYQSSRKRTNLTNRGIDPQGRLAKNWAAARVVEDAVARGHLGIEHDEVASAEFDLPLAIPERSGFDYGEIVVNRGLPGPAMIGADSRPARANRWRVEGENQQAATAFDER